MSFNLSESSDFKIKFLAIQDGNETYDIAMVFDELNIFENMFMPCMSGNILIRDTNNIAAAIDLLQSKLIIEIEKSNDNPDLFNFKKTFVIWKIADKVNVNMGTQMYTLHFVSEEWVKSEQKINNFSYKGLYSQAINKILIDDLGIEASRIPFSKTVTTPGFVNTRGIHDIIIPEKHRKPFDAIDWLVKRSIPNSQNSNIPDCVFFESKDKFYFTSIGDLSQLEPVFPDGIFIRPKNLKDKTRSGTELLDAINHRILQPTNLAENIINGVYAGKFFGWDSLVRTQKTIKYDFYYFWNRSKHFNNYPIIPKKQEKDLITNFDSRVVFYPFASERRNVDYVKKENNVDASIIDNTEEYVLQRKMIIYNLTQRRVQLTMPGNFGLTVGSVVKLEFPNFIAGLKDDASMDESMSGKYVITAARHIIRHDRHETVIEISTDSTNSDKQI